MADWMSTTKHNSFKKQVLCHVLMKRRTVFKLLGLGLFVVCKLVKEIDSVNT